MADTVPVIQVDGEEMDAEVAGKTLDNHTDLEELTDTEDSDSGKRGHPAPRVLKKKKVKKSKASLLSAVPLDTSSLTDTEQIDVDEETGKVESVTLAEVPNFYKPLKPKIVQLRDDKDGNVRVNNIVRGISVQVVTNPSSEGIQLSLLGVDPIDDDPHTDIDSIDGGSDDESAAAAEEIELGILDSYDVGTKTTSEILEHSFLPATSPVTPDILVTDSNAMPQFSLLVPSHTGESLTDVEDLGVSDEEVINRSSLRPAETNAAQLTDTEDIDIETSRPLTPEPLPPSNGPARRVRPTVTMIEEDEDGRILVSTGTEREMTPSPYLSVHSDNMDPLTDIENYGGSESEDEQREFETPDVEMFEGSNTVVRDQEERKDAQEPSDGTVEGVATKGMHSLTVPAAESQALTDTEDMESSDIEESSITGIPEVSKK